MKVPALRTDPIKPDEIAAMVNRPDATVIEVGANNGGHSRMFLNIFPTGRIYCFEPDERCIRQWRERTRDDRAQLFETAVGDQDGTVTFHLSDGRESEGFPQGWDSSSSLLEPTPEIYARWPWLRFERKVQVPCARLDTWAKQHDLPTIDFLWADVQGAEAQLIAGAQATLARTRFFYTEYGRTAYYRGQAGLEQLCALLPDFEVISLWKDDVLFARRPRDVA